MSRLIRNPYLVGLVVVRCSNWMSLQSIFKSGRCSQVPAAETAKELRRLVAGLNRTLADLQNVSVVADHQINMQARNGVVDPLDQARISLAALLECAQFAERLCVEMAGRQRYATRTRAEHLLIAMVLDVLPIEAMPRSVGSNSKLVRLFTSIYPAVGLQIDPGEPSQRPRDHLKSYFKSAG